MTVSPAGSERQGQPPPLDGWQPSNADIEAGAQLAFDQARARARQGGPTIDNPDGLWRFLLGKYGNPKHWPELHRMLWPPAAPNDCQDDKPKPPPERRDYLGDGHLMTEEEWLDLYWQREGEPTDEGPRPMRHPFDWLRGRWPRDYIKLQELEVRGVRRDGLLGHARALMDAKWAHLIRQRGRRFIRRNGIYQRDVQDAFRQVVQRTWLDSCAPKPPPPNVVEFPCDGADLKEREA